MPNQTDGAGEGFSIRDLGRQTRRALGQIGVTRLVASSVFVILAVLVARFGWSIPLIVDAERALYDLRSTIVAPAVGEDNRIALVVYDTQTLAKTEKRSPLDRALLARAIARIDAMQPRAIGIDILIGQPQPEDEQLIAALRSLHTPTWLAFASSSSMPDSVEPSEEQFLHYFHERLEGSRVQPASINIDVDPDNVVRRWPKQPGAAPPLLPLALSSATPAMRHYSGAIVFRQPALANTPLYPKLPIYLFSPGAASVSLDEALAHIVNGRTILIGADLPFDDRFATPATILTQGDVSGVRVQADILAQALDRQRLRAIPAWSLWLAALAVVFAGAVTGAEDNRRWWHWFVTVVELALLIAIPFWLQSQGVDSLNLPMFGWLAGWTIACAAAAAAARSIGAEQRQFARSALGRYLPRDIATEILRSPDRLNLRGEKREIYAVFTDLEGFTTLSHMMDPETVAVLVNRYLDMLSEAVLEHGGTIDKFVGDSVVAFWGAPISRPDDADRAARAALALHRAGEVFRSSTPAGMPGVGRTRVGLHRGAAIVGNFGGEGRFQYTAFGDSMNTASRLEGANKQLRSSVLASAHAAEHSTLDGYRPLGRVILRGRATPIDVLELKPEFPEIARRRLSDAFAKFDAGDADALADIVSLADEFPQDEALWNLVVRLRSVGPGGAFALS